jgi:hypothetical protein
MDFLSADEISSEFATGAWYWGMAGVANTSNIFLALA